MERPNGSLCELYASMLAKYFDVLVPDPAIILIENDLAEAVAAAVNHSRHADIIRKSVGLNFGSLFTTNISSWPVDEHVPAVMQEDAARIFAFDALIQNPDRHFANPNLGICGDQLIVFDHELAFSFLSAIFPASEPWNIAAEDYLGNHVFARSLRGTRCPQDLLERLRNLSDAQIQEFAEQIPESWDTDGLSTIEAHLRLMREHAEEFAEEVTKRLA